MTVSHPMILLKRVIAYIKDFYKESLILKSIINEKKCNVFCRNYCSAFMG